jgi:DNA-binding transcriptional LysR family regulator
MLNFNQLRTFYYAAKNLNFTAAASELFITQPAVTAQVKSFEEFCNLKLFKKKGRKLHLTDEGLALFDYAENIFKYEKEILNAIDDMKELKRGDLRLGTTKTYARYFMPFLISSFRKAYPHIKIHLDEGSSRDMIYSLVDLKNEVADIARAEDHPDVSFFPFSREEMVIITSTDHPLATKKPVSFRQLVQEPFIMKEDGSGTQKLVERLYARENCEPNVLMETSNSEFIKQLVMRGEGISFLVKEAVVAEIKEGKLTTIPLKGSKIFLDVSIAYLKDQNLSPAAKAFVDTLRKLETEVLHPMGIGALMAKMLAQRKEEQKSKS